MVDSPEALPNETSSNLKLVGNVLLRFVTGFRWIEVKDFAFVEDAPDKKLLASLIKNASFKTGTYTFGPDTGASGHGPYRLDLLTPESYRRIEVHSVTSVIDAFSSLDGHVLSRDLIDDVNFIVRRRIHQATVMYELPELKEAQHVAGKVFDKFHELIGIQRQSRVLSVIILGID